MQPWFLKLLWLMTCMAAILASFVSILFLVGIAFVLIENAGLRIPFPPHLLGIALIGLWLWWWAKD